MGHNPQVEKDCSRGKRKMESTRRHMMRCLGHYTDLERGSKKQDLGVLGRLKDKPNTSPATNVGRCQQG